MEKIIIGDKTFKEGDLVGFYIGNKLYEAGYVTFGKFNAEIYDVYGWFVADKSGKQVSEAGLNYLYDKISQKEYEKYIKNKE